MKSAVYLLLISLFIQCDEHFHEDPLQGFYPGDNWEGVPCECNGFGLRGSWNASRIEFKNEGFILPNIGSAIIDFFNDNKFNLNINISLDTLSNSYDSSKYLPNVHIFLAGKYWYADSCEYRGMPAPTWVCVHMGLCTLNIDSCSLNELENQFIYFKYSDSEFDFNVPYKEDKIYLYYSR